MAIQFWQQRVQRVDHNARRLLVSLPYLRQELGVALNAAEFHASPIPVFPHKLEEADGVAQRVDVTGVGAIVNGADGNADDLVAGALPELALDHFTTTSVRISAPNVPSVFCCRSLYREWCHPGSHQLQMVA